MYHADYTQEQDMEIEALEAILMDEFKGSFMPFADLVVLSICFSYLEKGLICFLIFLFDISW